MLTPPRDACAARGDSRRWTCLREAGRLGSLLIFVLLATAFEARARGDGPVGLPGGDAGHSAKSFPDGRFVLERGDVVALLGGADVAAEQENGHIEALLAVKYAGVGVRLRNFGWEGDTVFSRPRDVGFPGMEELLKRAGVSVIVLQFGRAEALAGQPDWAAFAAAYGKILDECARLTPRLALVTPPPFEKGGGFLPDLSLRNWVLAAGAETIRTMARERGLPVIDLFAALRGENHREPRLTDNGLQLTPRGHAHVARAFARQAGFGPLAERAGEPDARGIWPQAGFERVRQAVLARNRLWMNYWRPENWAFLGGDRTEQPSSRDHRNPKIRWFPEEIKEFGPLIALADAGIDEAARNAAP